MKILLANPRGFCAGVKMAIASLELALETLPAPVYVYHEIVHNQSVVNRFRDRDVVFVDDLEQVPAGATLLFSAHGVSPEVRQIARQRNLRTIDATCPLVTKVHLEAVRFAREGYHIVLVGHKGHDEVIGTMGEAPGAITLVESVDDVDALPFAENTKLACLTQTTLSVDDARQVMNRLRQRYPRLVTPSKDDICYATQNRQEAVSVLLARAELVLVLGSQNSSNSRRLKELAEQRKIAAYLIDGAADIVDDWFDNVGVVLVTAGASAPESVVQECVEYLQQRFHAEIEEHTLRKEEVRFPLPKELRVLHGSL